MNEQTPWREVRRWMRVSTPVNKAGAGGATRRLPQLAGPLVIGALGVGAVGAGIAWRALATTRGGGLAQRFEAIVWSAIDEAGAGQRATGSGPQAGGPHPGTAGPHPGGGAQPGTARPHPGGGAHHGRGSRATKGPRSGGAPLSASGAGPGGGPLSASSGAGVGGGKRKGARGGAARVLVEVGEGFGRPSLVSADIIVADGGGGDGGAVPMLDRVTRALWDNPEMAPVNVRARVLQSTGGELEEPGAQSECLADMTTIGFADEIARPDELFARYGAPASDPAWRP